MMLAKLLVTLLLVDMARAYFRGEGIVESRGNRNIRHRFLQQMDTKDEGYPFTSPSLAPAAPSPASDMVSNPSSFVVELLEFAVSMENSAYSYSVTNLLDAHLTLELAKEFSSLLSVDLLQTGTVAGLASLTALAYSGSATFDGSVSADEVRKAQTLILQDSVTMKKIAPKIVSISMLNGETQFAPAGLIVVVIVSTIGLLAAMFFGYRRYKSKHGQSSAEDMNELDSARKELPQRDDMSHAALSFGRNTEIDDYSLDEFSTTAESEAGHNMIQSHQKQHELSEDDYSFDLASTLDYDTDQEIIQTYRKQDMHGDEFSIEVDLAADYDTDNDNSHMSSLHVRNAMTSSKQHQLSKPKVPSNFGESCDDFSYNHVGNKGMESDDDDVYTTDNESLSAKPGSGGNANYMKRFVTMLGGDQDDEDEYLEDEELAPAPVPLGQPNRPFDEPSVERASRLNSNLGNAQNDYDGDGDDEENFATGRNRVDNGAESVDAGQKGAKSLKRERRKDQYSTRKTR